MVDGNYFEELKMKFCKKKLFDKKNIEIACPNCGKFLTKADKEDVRIHKLVCRNCKKCVWYVPANNCREIKEIPQRESGSGMRFY